MIYIKSITLKNGLPTVRYSSLVGDGLQGVTYPEADKNTPDILPHSSFVDALERLTDHLVDDRELPASYEWTLKSITFAWDEERSDYNFKAGLLGVQVGVCKLSVSVEPLAISEISEATKKKLAAVESEAVRFVKGKSAQGSLFSEDDEIEEAA